MPLVSEIVVSGHSYMLDFLVDLVMSHDIKSTDDFNSSSCSRLFLAPVIVVRMTVYPPALNFVVWEFVEYRCYSLTTGQCK